MPVIEDSDVQVATKPVKTPKKATVKEGKVKVKEEFPDDTPAEVTATKAAKVEAEPKPKKAKAKAKTSKREVLYPELSAEIFIGDESLTPDNAKKLLAWVSPEEGEPKLEDPHLLDIHGRGVVCNRLLMQRPYYKAVANDLMHDMLAGHWQNNLESIIIGETGMVLDGKHRLIALVLAGQEYARNPDQYPYWKHEPTIEVLVAYGAKEDAEVVNTIGIGKYRSLADSLFASGVIDETLSLKEKKQYSKVTEFAVRMLWARTGAMENAYSPRIRHADALDFLQRHEMIHHCVKTIIEENSGSLKSLEKVLPLGACSGLLYLMAVSTEDQGDTYRNAPVQSERILSFDNMETAESYWLALSSKSPTVKPVLNALAKMVEAENTDVEEKIAIVIKGWNAFRKNAAVVAKDVHLKTTTDDNGYRQLLEIPVIADSIDHPME